MRPRRGRPLEELVPTTGAQPFFAVRRRASHWPFAWHQHSVYELTLILRGTGRRHVGASVEAFSSGDLVLLGPHLPHTWVSEPEPGRSVEAVVLQFEPGFLGPRWQDIAELAPLATLLEDAARGLVFPPPTPATLTALTAMDPGPQRLAQLLHLLGALAHGPRRSLLLTAERSAPRADRWARLVDDGAAHPERLPPQAAAARRVGLAPSAFSRAFHRRFGVPYQTWRTRVRLEYACRRLADTADPIASIALDCGFSSLSAFNRQFHRAYGTAPRAWRAAAGHAATTP